MTYTVDTQELRKAMVDADLITVVSLAEASGVDRNTIGSILNEKTRPSAQVIEKLADALSLNGERIGSIFFTKKLA